MAKLFEGTVGFIKDKAGAIISEIRKKSRKKKKEEEVQKEYLTDAELTKTLKEFYKTIYWQAIKQFNYSALSSADSTLRSLDAFKEPTQMARTQGIITGLFYLENYVNGLVNPIKEEDIPNYNN